MDEVSPERLQKIFAEKEAKAQLVKQRSVAALRKKRAKDRANSPLKGVDNVSEAIRETRWLTAVLSGVNQTQAARDAGFASNSSDALENTARRLRQKFAKKLADAILDKDRMVAMLNQQSIGPGPHIAFNEDTAEEDQAQTLRNLADADARWLIVGVKQGKYGQEILYRNPDMATKILADAAGLTVAPKVDVSIILQGKTEEEKRAIRDGAMQRLLETKQRDTAVEGEYRDDVHPG